MVDDCWTGLGALALIWYCVTWFSWLFFDDCRPVPIALRIQRAPSWLPAGSGLQRAPAKDATILRRERRAMGSDGRKCEAKKGREEPRRVFLISLTCLRRATADESCVLIVERFFSAVPHGHLLGVRSQDTLFSPRRRPSGTGGASTWEGWGSGDATPLKLNQSPEFGGWREGCRRAWRAHCTGRARGPVQQ